MGGLSSISISDTKWNMSGDLMNPVPISVIIDTIFGKGIHKKLSAHAKKNHQATLILRKKKWVVIRGSDFQPKAIVFISFTAPHIMGYISKDLMKQVHTHNGFAFCSWEHYLMLYVTLEKGCVVM